MSETATNNVEALMMRSPALLTSPFKDVPTFPPTPSLASIFQNTTIAPDWISFVFNPDPSEEDSILSKFQAFNIYYDNTHNDIGNFKHLAFVSVEKPGAVPGSCDLRLECFPRVKYVGASFFRAVWNPSSADMVKVKAVLNSLLPPYGYNRLMVNGNLTRFDLACDCPGLDIKGNLYYRSHVSKAHPIFTDSVLETIYIGSCRSAVQFAVYDKNLQQFRKNGTLPIHPHLTRIEARLRGHFPIDEIQDRLVKSFKSFHIAPYSSSGNTVEAQAFFDLCRSEGVNKALRSKPKHLRRNLRDQLNLVSLFDLLGDRLETSIGEAVHAVLFPTTTVL